MSTNNSIVGDHDFSKAYEVAKTPYQKDILINIQKISGSDLKGKARRYSGSYLNSRYNLLKRVKESGATCYVVRHRKNGRLELWFGQLPNGSEHTKEKYLGLNVWNKG